MEHKLHLGCGPKYLPGFIHIDAMQYDHVDYVASIETLPMFEDNTISEIYACHCLGHFYRHNVKSVLSEWYRVLSPGGLLRLAVPDFEAIVEEYQQSKQLEPIIGLLYGGQTYEYNMHHITFDFASLMQTLCSVGFSQVTRYDWQDFLPDEFDDFSRAYLPHLDFNNGRLMSLNIVAEKM